MNYLSTFRNKKIIVTGHTGFKGSWLAFLLNDLGAEVMGFALPPLGLADKESLPIQLEQVSRKFSASLTIVDRLDVSLRLMVPQGYRILSTPGG